MKLVKLRRRFRLCRRDQYGTRTLLGDGESVTRKPLLGAGEFVRSTPLGRELVLRIELRMIAANYYVIPGIYEWDEYRRSMPAIAAHVAALAAALRRYKARRVERALFHFVAQPSPPEFFVLSPLYSAPGARKAAIKWRRLRERRAAAAAALLRKSKDQACAVRGASLLGEMKARLVRPCAILYLAYLVSVSVLSCMVPRKKCIFHPLNIIKV
ncbi:hypothetical protein C2845_PM07G00600 [Panicum miliaceum]|uniref:Uncharacterized protein n=1 Tax=Panicum miliaceum TaxID=4540 RepID=A0A3L6SKL6_PANMI|nr:hypothetical protein C2845_PM07G00600 [Panicum miliaceum]